MSYDLAVWEGPAPASNAAALATYRELMDRWQDEGVVDAIRAKMRGEPTAYDPTRAIAGYVSELLRRWPDIGDDEEESPWADAPLINNATGPLFYFSMVFGCALSIPATSKGALAASMTAGASLEVHLRSPGPRDERAEGA